MAIAGGGIMEKPCIPNEEFVNACGELINAISELIKIIANNIKEAFGDNIDWVRLNELTKKDNRKIVHLMYEHPKKRVRNKNLKRFEKIVEKRKKGGR